MSSSRSLPLFLAGTFSFRVGRGGRGGLGDDNRSLGRLSEMLWVGEDAGSADDGTLVGLDILGRDTTNQGDNNGITTRKKAEQRINYVDTERS